MKRFKLSDIELFPKFEEVVNMKLMNTESKLFVKDSFWTCITCKSYIARKKMPKISSMNALQIFDRPSFLNLTEVENVMIAPRINFIKMIKLPVSRMKGIRDKIINVPIPLENVKKTIHSLPRNLDEASVIPIMLKRKREYLSNVFHQYIRPEVIRKAVPFLCDKYPFYEGFDFDLEKLRNIEDTFLDACEETLESESFSMIRDEILDIEDAALTEDKEEFEYITKDAVKKNQSNIGDSYFLVPENIPINVAKKPKNTDDSADLLTVAPGEGQRPSNILKEKHPFVLHFPCLFPDGKGGLHDENRKMKITPQQFLSQRIQNLNPVFAQNKPFIFSAVYYIEKYQLQSKVNISYMRGKVRTNEEGKSFLKMEDGFSVFDNIKGSPRYWQKLRYDLIAKLEQLGPFQFFYTLSCADKRWDENIATLIMKHRKHLKVMHVMEENENDESFLDTSEEEIFNEKNDYSDEDELTNNEDYVEIIEKLSPEQDGVDPETLESEYWIHEKLLATYLDAKEHCKLHSYSEGFVCKRYNLNNFPKTDKNKLLEENVLDVTKNFNHRVKSFRRSILMAPQSPLKIEYYQDRTEFQARGHGHIHGCAWSSFEELKKTHPSLKIAFLKLKQNKPLENDNKLSLIKFINETVTCTLSAKKIQKFGLSRKRAIRIINMVKEVNIHNHTKTCKKYSEICRFLFPRYPSYYTIIAQKPSSELSDEEKVSFWTNIDIILDTMKDSLKALESYDITLKELLLKIFPHCKIKNEDGMKKIVINVGDKRAVFSYNDVIETASFLSGTQ